MNLTPDEQEEILTNYSKSCIARMLAKDDKNFTWIRNNYEQAVKNGRNSIIEAIQDGRDSWERIAIVAAEYKNSL